jgi:hypothetical protein
MRNMYSQAEIAGKFGIGEDIVAGAVHQVLGKGTMGSVQRGRAGERTFATGISGTTAKSSGWEYSSQNMKTGRFAMTQAQHDRLVGNITGKRTPRVSRVARGPTRTAAGPLPLFPDYMPTETKTAVPKMPKGSPQKTMKVPKYYQPELPFREGTFLKGGPGKGGKGPLWQRLQRASKSAVSSGPVNWTSQGPLLGDFTGSKWKLPKEARLLESA